MVNLDSLIMIAVILINSLRSVLIRDGGCSHIVTGIITIHKWLALNLDLKVCTYMFEYYPKLGGYGHDFSICFVTLIVWRILNGS